MDDETNVSFNLLLKSPKKEKKRRVLRRKALNYKGNVLSKELLTESEKTQVKQDNQLNFQPKKKARTSVENCSRRNNRGLSEPGIVSYVKPER